MDVLRYNELDVAGLSEQVDRAEEFLREGNFRAAEAKKLVGTCYYRAKLTASDRLLFRFARQGDSRYILLLEVIRNHAYDRSRFLNGAIADESKVEDLSAPDASRDGAASLVYVNRRLRHFHVLDKILSFDDLQSEVFALRPPLILIGSAGSGKTVLTLEKVKQLTGDILYVTLSPYLAENARNLYYANGYDNERQNIDFLSYGEFLESIRVPGGRAVAFADFAAWFGRRSRSSPIRDVQQLFEEIHGVLTGSAVDRPYLSRDDYRNLGVRQSIFLGAERDAVYDLFEKYLEFLGAEGLYNPNLTAYGYLAHVVPSYDFVLADEVQDLTTVQLYLALRTLRAPENFVLCGDANQIVHPNYFSWAQVKTLFYERPPAGRAEIIRVLDANYRNSPPVTELANRLLLIKNARFGSIDRESNYLVRPVCDHPGEVELLGDEDAVRRELNAKTRRSARTAVMVMRAEDKAEARRHFQTPLIFSIQEGKGLEYESVILLNFVSANSRAFEEIIEGVSAEDARGETLEYARAKDKGDKSLDAYKFFVNALYVAMTRAIKNLYLVEKNAAHRLFDLLGLALKREGARIKDQVSTREEWKEEARKLELQGKREQAEEIRRVILAQTDVPWRVLTPRNLADLMGEALNPEHYNRQAKLLLFEYAVVHQVPHLLRALAALNFNAAGEPARQRDSIENKYYRSYQGNQDEIRNKIGFYGVDFRNPLNQTPLMIAAQLGLEEFARRLVRNGANPHLTDNWGRTSLQNALRQAYLSEDFAQKHIGRLYGILAPSSLKVRIGDRLIKIDGKCMEFFLIHSMMAMLQEILRVKIQRDIPAFQTRDFVRALQHFPNHVIPEHRTARPYLSAVLAKNEIHREGPYNRRLFVRVRWGYYVLNPILEVEIEGKWINIYDLIHLKEFENDQENPNLKRFAATIRSWREAAAKAPGERKDT
ncbi:MAG: hypothetical protein NTV79_09425 [Candidatus Aureabacteria bacterium]|nr:hypothetical protein [Candidatus Auribacterota bacterium]